ncbi:single-stranded DNA-binding protein [Vibrio sp. SCSIO 43140]|uniref:single-stranded DNA-binding protein n=1 Tax=Vibrio sp. SCSIO 43140 TaxID=2819100 RepID=UPI0020758803|nr:single-stranded DNA-binding protein [Vibrio sp. SCSIO 43140]USD58857.1 single-stranded DNA-binding protein [Vibrio sp. SCSIO 43140]
MKHFRSNTGLMAVIVTGSQVNNGNTTIWADQITSWLDNSNNEQTRTNQIMLFVNSDYQPNVGQGLLVKVAYKTMKQQGQNNSQYTVSYYDLIDVLGVIDPNSIQAAGAPSLALFTLGGNIGSIEQKNANGNTWYNATVALTRSFKDENQNWQDETHWARISISQKTFEMNCKQGLDKGDSVMLECELSTNTYNDNHGNSVQGHEFRVNRVLGIVKKYEFEMLKQANQSAPQAANNGQPNAPQNGFRPTPAQNSGHNNNGNQNASSNQNPNPQGFRPQQGPAFRQRGFNQQ